jgi:hypothetical protein
MEIKPSSVHQIKIGEKRVKYLSTVVGYNRLHAEKITCALANLILFDVFS